MTYCWTPEVLNKKKSFLEQVFLSHGAVFTEDWSYSDDLGYHEAIQTCHLKQNVIITFGDWSNYNQFAVLIG